MTTPALKSAPSVKDQVSPEEWERRVELAAAYRLVALYGWDDLIFTHLSVRIPGPEHHFLMNPWNLMFEEITASSLVKVDVEGQPVMATPYMTNPAGFTVHSAIHMAREDAQAVMHTPPQGVPGKVAMQSSPMVMAPVARLLAWPALLRKLDRIDPSFRN